MHRVPFKWKIIFKALDYKKEKCIIKMDSFKEHLWMESEMGKEDRLILKKDYPLLVSGMAVFYKEKERFKKMSRFIKLFGKLEYKQIEP